MSSTHPAGSPRAFYDALAASYDLIYADWAASISRQGRSLDALLERYEVARADPVLDCACGIGTQLLGLAAHGRTVVGTDLSPVAAARAATEARRLNLRPTVAAADLRALPFRDGQFAAALCADNSLPHLLTPESLGAGLTELARVLRPGSPLLISTRDYDAVRREHPSATPPTLHAGTEGTEDRVITFQLWHWHADGERYDVEQFILAGSGRDEWDVVRRTTTYWALTRAQLEDALRSAGWQSISWQEPSDSGFFQPIVLARR